MTKIEWAHLPGYKGVSWNPIRAEYEGETGWHCTKVSSGCINCYSERLNLRLGTQIGYNNASPVRIYLDKVNDVYRWSKQRAVFVCSMTDLFGEFVEDAWIHQIFKAFIDNPGHIFMVLTKRPDRMVQVLKNKRLTPNVWLGVTAENQKCLDERVPLLLKTNASVRFISMEPLIGPVDPVPVVFDVNSCNRTNWYSTDVDWIIVGGESGPDARPMHPDWVRAMCGLCGTADTPFFFKQWGEWIHESQLTSPVKAKSHSWPDGSASFRVGRRKAGRLLDGVEWSEFPEVGDV